MKSRFLLLVDGTLVRSFSQFVEMVDDGTDPFLELTTNLGNIIVIDREKAIAVNGEILSRYGIPVDRIFFLANVRRIDNAVATGENSAIGNYLTSTILLTSCWSPTETTAK